MRLFGRDRVRLAFLADLDDENFRWRTTGIEHLVQDVDRLDAFRTIFKVGTEEHVVADLSVAYRFPGRRAVFNVEVKNVFDQSFFYQDDNFVRRSELSPTGIFPQRIFST